MVLPNLLIETGRRATFSKSPSEKGLSDRGEADSKRCLTPDLEAPCGPRPPGGSIAGIIFDTKAT